VSKEVTAQVAEAVREIRAAFPSHQVNFIGDDQGGAFVRVDGVEIGSAFTPNTSWIGFQITFQYPFADVYPHYLRADLARVNRQAFVQPFHSGHTFSWPGGEETSLMVSRRSKYQYPAVETVAIKLSKVVDWLRQQ
jgi:hypothetical protein